MHRLAITTACLALVLGVAHAHAEPSVKTHRDAAQDPSTQKGQAGKTPANGTGARGEAGAREPAVQKRSARPSLSAVRERTLTPLGRERKAPTLETQLAAELESVWSGRHLRQGTTAVYVVDALTGKPLYAVHEDERLNPASNVKLIATATALDVLGPAWRYLTRLLGPTPDEDGVVRGDVYFLGSYDPTLESAHVQAMAREVAAAGVNRIEGDIYVGTMDDARRDSVHRPALSLRIQGGSSPGQPAQITVTPASEIVQVESQVTTAKGRVRPRIQIGASLIEDEERGAYYRVELTGHIAAGRHTTQRRALPRGEVFTAHLMRSALIDAGVAVTGTVAQAALPDYVARASSYLPVDLARHESAPLSELVARINKRSINDLADRVIATAGAVRYGGPPAMDKGIAAMHEWLRENAGVNPEGLVLDTGSGLSYRTELTARQIVKVLRSAGGYHAPGSHDAAPGSAVAAGADAEAVDRGEARPGSAVASLDPASIDAPAATAAAAQASDVTLDWSEAMTGRHGELEQVFLDSLAVAGVDGTLTRRFRRSSARGNMIGKTGTLTRVVALSGIVQEGGGPAVAFAILTNGHAQPRRGTVRKQHEAMVEAIQRYVRARQRAAAGR